MLSTYQNEFTTSINQNLPIFQHEQRWHVTSPNQARQSHTVNSVNSVYIKCQFETLLLGPVFFLKKNYRRTHGRTERLQLLLQASGQQRCCPSFIGGSGPGRSTWRRCIRDVAAAPSFSHPVVRSSGGERTPRASEPQSKQNHINCRTKTSKRARTIPRPKKIRADVRLSYGPRSQVQVEEPTTRKSTRKPLLAIDR